MTRTKQRAKTRAELEAHLRRVEDRLSMAQGHHDTAREAQLADQAEGIRRQIRDLEKGVA